MNKKVRVITFANPSGRFTHIDPGGFVVVLSSQDKIIFFFLVLSLGFTKVAVIGTESVQDCYPLVLNISIVLVNILSRRIKIIIEYFFKLKS